MPASVRRILFVMVGAIIGVLLIPTGWTVAAGAGKGPYVIALSNSFIGNDWRAQMEKEVQAEAQTPRDRHLVKRLVIENAGNNAASQISQMQSMIAQHVDAIIVDAASPTSLNNVIAQAHQRGILVVSFDNLVTSPYAIKQNYNNVDWGAKGAQFVAATLHGTGNVVLLQGVAGTTAEVDRENGVAQVFQKYSGIKIISRVQGGWSESGGHSAMAAVLASGVKFDAIWSSGDMAGGAVSALLQAHHALVPMTDAAFNDFLQIMSKYQSQGLAGLAVGDSDWSGAAALNTALDALEGHQVSMNIVNPISTYGASAYDPKVPPSFNIDYTSPVLGPNGQLSVQDVLTGTCCHP